MEEVPIPEPGPEQIQVAIRALSVCHTDLHAAEGDWPVKPPPPFILGHEGVGFVSAGGTGVKHVKEGDRVGVPWPHSARGHCRHCLGGWEALCHEQKNTGHSVNGGFAEYALADPNFVGHLRRRSASSRSPRFSAPASRSTKRSRSPTPSRAIGVVVSGIGGLGHIAVQSAAAMGLNVAEVDVAEDKLDLARKLGPLLTVNAAVEDPAAVIPRETGGGAQGVLVTAVSPEPSRRQSACSGEVAPCRSSGCHREAFRSTSSAWCLTASRCEAQSSALGLNCRSRWISQRGAR